MTNSFGSLLPSWPLVEASSPHLQPLTQIALRDLAALVVLLVLSASVVAKLAYREATMDFLSSLLPGLSPRLTMPVAMLGEALILMTLLVAPGPGAGLAALWILTATVFLSLAKTRLISCGCFGKVTAITSRTFARNGALVLACLIAWSVPTNMDASQLTSAAILGAGFVAVRASFDEQGTVHS